GLIGLAEKPEELLTGPGVEVASRLVGQDDGRIDDQRAGDRHSLHLAPGELVRPVASAVQQTHLRQGRLDAWADVPRAAVVEQERESDVLLGRVCGQEVEEL